MAGHREAVQELESARAERQRQYERATFLENSLKEMREELIRCRGRLEKFAQYNEKLDGLENMGAELDRLRDQERASRERLEQLAGHNRRLLELKALEDELIQLKSREKAYREQLENLAKYEKKLSGLSALEGELVRLRAKEKEYRDRINEHITSANLRARQILDAARQKAEEIAGDAIAVARDYRQYEQAVRAMRNVVEGYGNRYLIPGQSLLDELAELYGHTEAGRELKRARDQVRQMVENRSAAECDYVEAGRRDTAIDFVVDAFNGKVDTILSRARKDNYGKLRQEILDAFTLVNFNGKAFRSARITDEYLNLRLDELKWACAAYEVKAREMEEQRQLREKMRDEERARKEYEKALRDAAKEEGMLKKALEKAQEQLAAASEAQKANYEAKLRDLEQKLKEAEEKRQRSLSMAQQTKRGHVYIISNIGSFGEGVYKIGMTRRLEPLDRVKELSDASVPFDFDVHALIESDDAPSLETALHKHFVLNRVNKVNHRREFFRTSVEDVKRQIQDLGLQAHWTLAAEARQYYETLAIEKAIAEDPEAREAWIKRQYILESDELAEILSGNDLDDAEESSNN